jgi:hypothetical protein
MTLVAQPASLRARVERAWKAKRFADAITALEAARAKSRRRA